MSGLKILSILMCIKMKFMSLFATFRFHADAKQFVNIRHSLSIVSNSGALAQRSAIIIEPCSSFCMVMASGMIPESVCSTYVGPDGAVLSEFCGILFSGLILGVANSFCNLSYQINA